MQVKYNSLQGEKVTSQYPRVLFMDTYEEPSPAALGTYIQAIDLVYVWPIGFPSNKYLPGLQNIP